MAKILVANGKVVKSNDQVKEKTRFVFRVGNKNTISTIEIYAYSEKQARYLLIQRARNEHLYIPYIELITFSEAEETKKSRIERLLKEYDEYDQAFCECIGDSDIKYNYADKMHEIDKELKVLGYKSEN